jgi:hypothetical protein
MVCFPRNEKKKKKKKNTKKIKNIKKKKKKSQAYMPIDPNTLPDSEKETCREQVLNKIKL